MGTRIPGLPKVVEIYRQPSPPGHMGNDMRVRAMLQDGAVVFEGADESLCAFFKERGVRNAEGKTVPVSAGPAFLSALCYWGNTYFYARRVA
ncbi:MAG: hypothetical protein WCJ29_04255 [bacterium]